MNLQDLKEPFEEDELEHRIGQCGESNGKIWAMSLTYVSARAIQDRLDKVCGPENWKVEYESLDTERLAPGIKCILSIKIANEWVSKQDGADQSEMDPFKGGLSGAFKRAGSTWGVGRYLYSLESTFADIVEKDIKGAKKGKTKEGKTFYWKPKPTPAWALPKKKEDFIKETEKMMKQAHKQMTSDLAKQDNHPVPEDGDFVWEDCTDNPPGTPGNLISKKPLPSINHIKETMTKVEKALHIEDFKLTVGKVHDGKMASEILKNNPGYIRQYMKGQELRGEIKKLVEYAVQRGLK